MTNKEGEREERIMLEVEPAIDSGPPHVQSSWSNSFRRAVSGATKTERKAEQRALEHTTKIFLCFFPHNLDIN